MELLQSLVDFCPDGLLEQTLDKFVESEKLGTQKSFVLPAEMEPYIRRAKLTKKQKLLWTHLSSDTLLRYLPQVDREDKVDRALQEVWPILSIIEWNDRVVKRLAETWLGYRGVDKLGDSGYESVKQRFIVYVLPTIE